MKNRIKKLKNRIDKSKDAKAITSNFSYLMVLQIANYIFPLLTIPYLARVIGVEGIGKIAFAAAITMIFRTIAEWGFNYSATRDLSQNRDDPEKTSEIFSNTLWARLLLTLLSFILLLISIAYIPYFKENKSILLVSFLMIPGHVFLSEWFFQAKEKMKYITIFGLISKLSFTILIFIFINKKDDYILQPLFLSLSSIICGFFSIYLILKKWKVKILAPTWKDISNSIKKSTDIFINNIMPNLYNNFSVTLLGFIGGSTANGLLDAGSKSVNIIHQFMMTLSRVFFPFLSRHLDKHNIFLKINITIAILSSILLFLFAPLIINYFYTYEFEKAIPVLKIMSISIIFTALINIYGINYMIVAGHEKQLRNITTICSIIGLILSFPLVYFYEYIGAAIVITFTKFILAIFISYKARKIITAKNQKLESKKIISTHKSSNS